MHSYDSIKNQDKAVFEALGGEEKREAEGIELIPSENYVSKAVLEALGSVFTNKYSEGYPGKRYYGGQEFTDQIETLAMERAKKIFGCGFVNVQPLSGAPANLAAYSAVLTPGDAVLGMALPDGGHLTHGHPMTLPAKLYRFVTYGLKNTETGEIDYDALRETAKREKPKIVLAGFSAYSRELDWKKFADIAHENGALAMADIAHIAGLIAGGVHENPFDHGFDIVTTTTHKTLRGPRGGMIMIRDDAELAKKIDKAVFPGIQGGPHMNNIAAKAIAFEEALQPSFKIYAAQILKNAKAMEEVCKREGLRMIGGGTSNHLILADVYGSYGVGGKDAQNVLDEVGITLNKNAISGDPRPPLDPSGIRFGTPALTTRGMKEKESARVAELMIDTLKNKDASEKKTAIRSEVREICAAFPIPDTFV